ncbi:hypothetical protein DOZ80_30855 [Pseudomonas fluorescens]|uniref:Uncharacterized protein n=1 Tax=Pseudomonas fluorescens TaxID=294 RepID=A0A327MHI0_PSEFL|nr:hypothetical protein DOZ80_30855 [Pseudomonas fluorescens]
MDLCPTHNPCGSEPAREDGRKNTQYSSRQKKARITAGLSFAVELLSRGDGPGRRYALPVAGGS